MHQTPTKDEPRTDSNTVGIIGGGIVDTGVVWWEGPDEDLGYVIAVPV